MKNILTILFINNQIVVYGQFDSLKIPPHFVVYGQIDSLNILQNYGPDYTKTIYPNNDSLTYNPYVGETIAGYTIADGWRRDNVNGGFNKEIYENPYIQDIRFVKQSFDNNAIFYRYDKGKLFTGSIADTLTVRFTPNKIVGYLYGNPYYESKNITVIFRANCVDGLLQGKGVICGIVPKYGIYNNLPLSECNFENGEIIGICKQWNLNSVNFEIQNGNIKCLESEYDYFEFCKLLELTEVTYVKGNPDYVKYTTFERNKTTGETKPIERKTSPEKITNR